MEKFTYLQIYYSDFVMENNEVKKMRKYDLNGKETNEFKEKLQKLCEEYSIKADSVLIRTNHDE
jgi:hypothetical protein